MFIIIEFRIGSDKPRPSTAPGLGVCEWSPEGLNDKSVSLIPNTDEILKLVKKKGIHWTPFGRHPDLEL